MSNYKCYEKIKDKYIIQNEDTLEIELIDEETYQEGIKLGLVQDKNLISIITRKLLSNNDGDMFIVFESNNYFIGYQNNSFFLEFIHDKNFRGYDFLIYIPMNITKLDIEEYSYTSLNRYSNINLTIAANGLEHPIKLDKLHILELDCTYYNTKKIRTMRGMFRWCNNVTKIKLGEFDTSNCIDMAYMFAECRYLREVDLSNWDMSKVVSIEAMFYRCPALRKVKFSNSSTTRLRYMQQLFYMCSNLDNIEFNGINTSHVVDMSEMFAGCDKLLKLDLSNFDTQNVKSMYKMFSCCNSLINLNISNFSSKNLNNCGEMFNYCSKLKKIDLSWLKKEVNDSLNIYNITSNCYHVEIIDYSGLEYNRNFEYFYNSLKTVSDIHGKEIIKLIFTKEFIDNMCNVGIMSTQLGYLFTGNFVTVILEKEKLNE